MDQDGAVVGGDDYWLELWFIFPERRTRLLDASTQLDPFRGSLRNGYCLVVVWCTLFRYVFLATCINGGFMYILLNVDSPNNELLFMI